jgi:hypothetical protein
MARFYQFAEALNRKSTVRRRLPSVQQPGRDACIENREMFFFYTGTSRVTDETIVAVWNANFFCHCGSPSLARKRFTVLVTVEFSMTLNALTHTSTLINKYPLFFQTGTY